MACRGAQGLCLVHGRNDLGLPLVDIATGSCRDGLHPDRANENRGAESLLSYLLSLCDMQQFERDLPLPVPIRLSGPSLFSLHDVG
jgi:hypothetical protein